MLSFSLAATSPSLFDRDCGWSTVFQNVETKQHKKSIQKFSIYISTKTLEILCKL